MQTLRAALRLTAIAVATAVLYAVYLAGRTLTRGSPSWRNIMVRRWARTLGRILALRANVEGPRPAGGFLLVANHVSYVDILLLAQYVDVVFVAKSEVRRWPAIGVLAASVGTLFIDRTSRRDALRVGREVDAVIRRGAGVVLFPEATSSDGSDVLPFRPALLEGAARSALPVHHAAIRYAPADVVPWWGDMELVPHLWQLLKAPRIEASLAFGGSVVARDRKELAQRLWQEVRGRLKVESSPS